MKGSVHGLALVLVLLAALPMTSPRATGWTSPVGLWKTFDDETDKARALVRVYETDGKLFARIERTLSSEDNASLCVACTDERKNQPINGLVIMRNVRSNGAGGYEGGDILDPESGSIYRCKLRLEEEGSALIVHGFVGMSLIGRSQRWRREE